MISFLKFLTEAKKKAAVITFGRLNPITIGHEKLAEKVRDVAKAKKADAIMFLSQSHDPKKNPLSFKDKIRLAKKAFPYLEISTDMSIKNVFHAAEKLSNAGYTDFTLVVGSDRVKEFEKALGRYVKTGIADKLDLQFDDFEVVSAGQRDENADDVSGMSASKMRKLVADGDLETFKKGLPKRLVKDAEKIFKLLTTEMGIKK